MVLVWRVSGAICSALVALCFLLPFGAIRTEEVVRGQVWGRGAQTWHSADLVVGGRARPHAEYLEWDDARQRTVLQDVTDRPEFRVGPDSRVPIPPQPVVIAAAVLILAGFGVAMLTAGRRWFVVSAILPFAAAAALGLGQWLFTLDVRHRYHLPPSSPVVPAYGFWLAIGALVLLGTGNAVVARLAYRRGELRRPEYQGVPGLGPD